MKMTRILVGISYGIVGAILLALGAITLLFNTGLLPDAFRRAIVEESRGDLTVVHILQELGCALVLVGMITFWFIKHYDHSHAFHWMLTAFLGLLALVHWFDVRGPFTSIADPIVNTAPFALFVAIGVLRATIERDRNR
jgi:hypothetical protein